MEPITTTILGALAAGAAATAKDTATQAIKDAYQGLKKLIEGKFADKPAAATALVEHETRPDVWKKPLEVALIDAGADQDKEIVRRARELRKMLEDAGLGGAYVQGSGAAATAGGVAAGQGGYAAGRDNVISGRPK